MEKDRERKKESWIVRGYESIILFLSLLFIVVLLWIALFSTSVISPDFNEHTYFTKSSVLRNTVLIIFIIILTIILGRDKRIQKFITSFNKNSQRYQKTERILFLILAGILAWWVLKLDCQPKADQQLIMETVKHMRFGDFTDFEKNGYVSRNAQQFGIVMTEYLLSFLSGTENYLALQLLNIPGVLLCYFMMEGILKETGVTPWIRMMTIFACILFFPFSMYVIFVYGTVWGLALALLSIYLEIRFFHDMQWKNLFLCCISITAAVFLKSNYEIFLIAMILTAVMEAIRKKKGKILLLPFVMIVFLCGEKGIFDMMMHRLAGEEYAAPMSSWTWVAIGTSENDVMADGWYSDAIGNDIYQLSNGDSEVDEILTRKIVIRNLETYRKEPERFIRFILNKTASQWNNPTFQCFWIVQRAPHVKTSLTQDPFVKNAYRYLKGWQICILTGAVCYLLSRERKRPEDLILLLIFVGGFVFHLFWEAKCQYTVVYFILLIPYAIQGYQSLAEKKISGKVLIALLILVIAGSTLLPVYSANVKVLQKDAWPALKDEQDPWGFTS